MFWFSIITMLFGCCVAVQCDRPNATGEQPASKRPREDKKVRGHLQSEWLKLALACQTETGNGVWWEKRSCLWGLTVWVGEGKKTRSGSSVTPKAFSQEAVQSAYDRAVHKKEQIDRGEIQLPRKQQIDREYHTDEEWIAVVEQTGLRSAAKRIYWQGKRHNRWIVNISYGGKRTVEYVPPKACTAEAIKEAHDEAKEILKSMEKLIANQIAIGSNHGNDGNDAAVKRKWPFADGEMQPSKRKQKHSVEEWNALVEQTGLKGAAKHIYWNSNKNNRCWLSVFSFRGRNYNGGSARPKGFSVEEITAAHEQAKQKLIKMKERLGIANPGAVQTVENAEVRENIPIKKDTLVQVSNCDDCKENHPDLAGKMGTVLAVEGDVYKIDFGSGEIEFISAEFCKAVDRDSNPTTVQTSPAEHAQNNPRSELTIAKGTAVKISDRKECGEQYSHLAGKMGMVREVVDDVYHVYFGFNQVAFVPARLCHVIDDM